MFSVVSLTQAGVVVTIAALSAYFWQMRINGICMSDLYGAAEDGYFDTGADDFVVSTLVRLGVSKCRVLGMFIALFFLFHVRRCFSIICCFKTGTVLSFFVCFFHRTSTVQFMSSNN